jgi:hypothetical protein
MHHRTFSLLGILNHSLATQGMEILMRYFVATELGVANLLQRNFDWAANALWYEEIPNAHDPYKTKFMVGGQDDIVNAEVGISALGCNVGCS